MVSKSGHMFVPASGTQKYVACEQWAKLDVRTTHLFIQVFFMYKVEGGLIFTSLPIPTSCQYQSWAWSNLLQGTTTQGKCGGVQ